MSLYTCSCISHIYLHSNLHSYLHIYLHIYLLTYFYSYLHRYLHRYLRRYLHIYLHIYIYTNFRVIIHFHTLPGVGWFDKRRDCQREAGKDFVHWTEVVSYCISLTHWLAGWLAGWPLTLFFTFSFYCYFFNYSGILSPVLRIWTHVSLWSRVRPTLTWCCDTRGL